MKDILKYFITEQEMSDALFLFLAPSLTLHQFKNIREYRSPTGIPDQLLVRCVSDDIVHSVALELKLRDWRQGLIQAFKYRAYVNIAYVVMDHNNIEIALDNLVLFQKANIGLASFSIDGYFRVWYSPSPDIPFSMQMGTEFSESMCQKLGMKRLLDRRCSRFLRSNLGYIDLKLIETWI